MATLELGIDASAAEAPVRRGRRVGPLFWMAIVWMMFVFAVAIFARMASVQSGMTGSK